MESCAPFTPPTTGCTEISPSFGSNRKNLTVFRSLGGVGAFSICSSPFVGVLSAERDNLDSRGFTAEKENSFAPTPRRLVTPERSVCGTSARRLDRACAGKAKARIDFPPARTDAVLRSLAWAGCNARPAATHNPDQPIKIRPISASLHLIRIFPAPRACCSALLRFYVGPLGVFYFAEPASSFEISTTQRHWPSGSSRQMAIPLKCKLIGAPFGPGTVISFVPGM
ncbi:MAG: hypothetical protein V7609_1744 [Verrucomicrobiota bacterium]